MANAESDVRNKIIQAIEGIATSDLGFDNQNGNIHGSLLDFEKSDSNAVVSYLMADVSGKKKVRAWGVQVLGREGITASTEVFTRFYEITIVGYYGEKAEAQSPINYLIDHALKVRGAIKDLTGNLGATVDKVGESSFLSISKVNIEDVGEIWEGRITYEAEKYNPSW